MKIKALILLLALTCNAKASLIDLTPGGFSNLNPPPAVIDWEQPPYGHDSFKMAFEDIRNGGSPLYLGPPLFNTTPLGGTTATFSWDLTGTPYFFNYLFVGTGPDAWENMYQVSPDQQKVGEAVITINDLYAINGIGIYGFPAVATPTPDAGSTLMMLAFSAICMVGLARKVVTRVGSRRSFC